jgi:hypothetical protein
VVTENTIIRFRTLEALIAPSGVLPWVECALTLDVWMDD